MSDIDPASLYEIGQELASTGNYKDGAKLHVLYMKNERFDGAIAELESMQEDIQSMLGITIDLKELINADPDKAVNYVARVWESRDSVRKAPDYAGAVYPCVVYELDHGDEYAALSPALSTGMGFSWDSAADAIDELRHCIEKRVQESCQDVPLPHELPLPQDDDEEWHLDFAHFISKLCTITQVTRTSVKLSDTL